MQEGYFLNLKKTPPYSKFYRKKIFSKKERYFHESKLNEI